MENHWMYFITFMFRWTFEIQNCY